jgi:hypothetical protein
MRCVSLMENDPFGWCACVKEILSTVQVLSTNSRFNMLNSRDTPGHFIVRLRSCWCSVRDVLPDWENSKEHASTVQIS